MTGISSGKTWSRIGPEVAPTDSAASGVWTLQEAAENEGAESAFEFLSSLTANGSTGTFSFTSLPQTYQTLRLVINARDTSTQYRPQIIFNNNTFSFYRVANLISENATYSTYVPTSLGGVNLNPIPVNNHPYTMTVDFPGYYSTAMVSPALLWFGQSDQTTGGGSNPMNVATGALFNGSDAITRIDVVNMSGNLLGANSTIGLFGIAA